MAYLLAFTSSWTRELRARSGMVFTVAFYACIMVVWGSIWWAAMRAAGGSIHGYAYGNMLWYILGTEASVIVVSSRRIDAIGAEIARGDLEAEMTRPVSVVGFRLASEAGQCCARLVWILPAALVLGVLYTGGLPDWRASAVAVPAVIVGTLCNVLGVYLFSALSFWSRDSRAAWFVYQKLIFLPGGMLLPLQFFPAALATWCWWTPFWSMAYAPGRLAAGFFEPLLLVGQSLWALLLLLATLVVFAAGERRIMQGRV